MTGPEHYREAERLLASTTTDRYVNLVKQLDSGGQAAIMAQVLDRAQVHATLALAAATALQTAGVYISADTSAGWSTTIGAGSHD